MFPHSCTFEVFWICLTEVISKNLIQLYNTVLWGTVTFWTFKTSTKTIHNNPWQSYKSGDHLLHPIPFFSITEICFPHFPIINFSNQLFFLFCTDEKPERFQKCVLQSIYIVNMSVAWRTCQKTKGANHIATNCVQRS